MNFLICYYNVPFLHYSPSFFACAHFAVMPPAEGAAQPLSCVEERYPPYLTWPYAADGAACGGAWLNCCRFASSCSFPSCLLFRVWNSCEGSYLGRSPGLHGSGSSQK